MKFLKYIATCTAKSMTVNDPKQGACSKCKFLVSGPIRWWGEGEVATAKKSPKYDKLSSAMIDKMLLIAVIFIAFGYKCSHNYGFPCTL